MSTMMFACPECHTVLKPDKPIPAGKKVRCPKCSHIFAPPPDKSKASPRIQAKPPVNAPTPRRREPDDDGWELVDDEASPPTRKPPGDSIPLAQPDEHRPEAEPDQDDDELAPGRRPRRKPQHSEEADEDRADDLDREEEEDRPRPKKRRKGKATGVSQLVKLYLILGAVTLLLLAGGGGVAAWLYINRDKNRGTGNEDPLAYVPADSKVVMGFDVGTLTKQPAIAAYVEKAFQENPVANSDFFHEMQKETGLELRDLFDRTIMAIKPSTAPGRPPESTTLILKSRVAFDQRKIRNSTRNATAKRYKGKTYFKVTGARFTALFMPSNWIIVVTNAPEAHVEGMIDSNGTQPGLPTDALALARQAGQSQIWIVAPFDQTIKQAIQQQLAQASPMLPANFGDMLGRAKAASLSGTLEASAVRFQVGLACADEASAKQASDGFQGIWDKQGKSQMALTTAVVPKFIGGFLKELADSLQFSSQGTMAQASAQVSVPTLETLVKEVQNQAARGLQPAGPPGMGPRGGPPGRPGSPGRDRP